MNQISEDGLFYTVLEMVQKIVKSIEYGVKFNESYIEVEDPDGQMLRIPRKKWKDETQVALEFFESYEYYEDCAKCVKILETLESEPTVEQLIHQLSEHAKSQQSSQELDS